MINVNNFEILDNGDSIALDVETNIDYFISDIKLWNIYTFKDYTLAKSLDFKIVGFTNREVFTVTKEELGIDKFEDIYFVEITSTFLDTDTCNGCEKPALAITYDLSAYDICILNMLYRTDIFNCVDCKDSIPDNTIITIDLYLDAIKRALEVGYYNQAIEIVKKVKKLCKENTCVECKPLI